MNIKAGDIRQLLVQGRELDVKGGDANVNIDLGGFSGEAGVAGNGNVYGTLRRKIPGFSDAPVIIDDEKKDLEFIQGLSNSGELVPVSLTLASGKVYTGSLFVVGDIMKATGDGTMTLEMRGKNFEQL